MELVTNRAVILKTPMTVKFGLPPIVLPVGTEVTLLARRVKGVHVLALVRYGATLGWLPLDSLSEPEEEEVPVV